MIDIVDALPSLRASLVAARAGHLSPHPHLHRQRHSAAHRFISYIHDFPGNAACAA
ncbi:hypothetical protein [Burkholderia sp. RF4-BP95]|uniref:hypothetical protein n=1 Tax=Burkholderia sp. RF4-BP95 TaxID=1637845 RepID=UPI0012E391AF|nr:hypothetical protein [Burkholderia sp. RF4-BP95]